ncbi:unnamed protein product [Brachionus calyciflorus]|uniref:CCAAT-binding factor domain-containing protein n=1 Tax=Brachionus calyciflorus TaxID=104777 RepID=A0A813MZS9_9BILA|nr:unnamed protein product [Brachionus calyciflorus]
MSSNLSQKIDDLTNQIIKNKKHSNSIVDLLKYASDSKKIQVCVKSINSLCSIYGSYLKDGKFALFKNQSEFDMFEKNVKNLNSDEKYRLWMHQRLNDLKQLLLDYLKNDTTKSPKFASVKIASLNGLFELVKNETIYKKVDENEEKHHIPQDLIESLVDAVLKTEMEDKLLKRMKYYMSFNDLRYFVLKYLTVEFYKKNNITETILENILNLFSVTPGLVKEEKKKPIPKPSDDLDMDLDLNGIDGDSKKNDELKTESENSEESDDIKLFALKKQNLVANSKIIQQDAHRKLFNDCFVNFLKHQLSPNLYKKLLIKLPEKLIPKMTNPLMLADFLTNSYNSGGLISVLALNSLFILISSYNLEYPNFYQKVYQLLDSAIFNTKYKDRFFQLLDMFLLSTHLSSVLVGAFIKKLSRMTLTCPPADLKFLIMFIYNLLIRHPNCKILIHNKSKVEVLEDPFDVNCMDYNKCNALKSSLWEIQSLKKHYCAYVSKEVEKLTSLSQTIEFPLDDAFENNSYESLIEIELDSNKATANCAINYSICLHEKDKEFFDRNVSSLVRIN